jgi:hypothetical protein
VVALPAQLGVHPRTAIDTPAGLVDLSDPLTQLLVVDLPAGRLMALPLVVGGPGDLP